VNLDLLASRLERIVGAAHVLADPQMKSPYEIDWTRRFTGESSFVVRPRTVEEVVALVGLARETGVPLVAQGGNTGLVGGAVPDDGAVVVSTERMTDVGDVEESAGTIRAEAGATLDDVARRAASADMFWPVAHAGGGRATVGGTIATNAGGTLSWQFGTARHHVRGVEAVLGDGRVIDRRGALVKDNAGYDLTGLLCGSEGTLGIVTSAALALQPRPPSAITALIAIDEPGSLARLAGACRRLPSMWAAEVVFDGAMDNLCDRLGLRRPFDQRFLAYALVRCVGERSSDDLAALAGGRPSLVDERVWDYRERQNEAVARSGVPVKLDVSLPVDALERFASWAVDAALEADVEAFVFGHLLDGNLHVNLVGDRAADLEETVVNGVVHHGGAVAAEHGIGRARSKWLSLARSHDEIAAMTGIKRALDPDGILNPGVVLGGGG